MENKGINVLSLFDGMSCGQIALERCGIKVNNYFASEIEKNSIVVTMKNYPNTLQLGDVTKLDSYTLPKIDLLIGGSPCQDISGLKKNNKGLNGEKSSLFYEFLRLKKELHSKNKELYFLLENVVGNLESIREITKFLGVKPIKLNSSLVSAQKRPRLYWTNIPVNSLPSNNNIQLDSILEATVNKNYYQTEAWLKWWDKNKEFQLLKSYSTLNSDKANCLTKRMYASWNGNFIKDEKGIRRLTPIECERLQNVPDNYTQVVKDTSRYEMLGNGWTVDIICHIFNHMKL